MPEDFSVEEAFPVTPLRPHPVIRIWKKSQKNAKRKYETYKKNRKNYKKKSKNGHIDIYV
ncbi:hypothetical protein [Nitratiruptor sp. SB155-2]|uniref:hypothetical protein n=1 Tax=Nitratiruptor sp. (strain SB155-2) TaxID=387092 RepID=UPI000300258A|nr:hypothetical protein [Nitratiruptor sp. SB155-2]